LDEGQIWSLFEWNNPTFHSVAVKTLIDLTGLDEVTHVRHPMGMLRLKRTRYATALDADSTERYLAHVTFRRRWGSTGKEVLAIATVQMTRRCAIIKVPRMIRIGDGIWDRLRTYPAIRVAWQTVRARASKIGALIEVRLG
jgi:hypothetical protein